MTHNDTAARITGELQDDIAAARSKLARLDENGAALQDGLKDARSRRAIHARDILFNGTPASKEWSAAMAEELQALALLADLVSLRPELVTSLSSAEGKAEAATQHAYDTAFKARMRSVMIERGIATPAGQFGRFFEVNVQDSYNWLSGVFRAPIKKDRTIGFWLDAAAVARVGSVPASALLVASYMHGDIEIQDGGESHNLFLGLDLYAGRPANSAPIIAKAA
jgi:hypothetical protein